MACDDCKDVQRADVRESLSPDEGKDFSILAVCVRGFMLRSILVYAEDVSSSAPLSTMHLDDWHPAFRLSVRVQS